MHKNQSFVCIHLPISPVIIDHKLSSWTIPKQDIVCKLINILVDLALGCFFIVSIAVFLLFVWLTVIQRRKGGMEHESKKESGLV